MFVVVVTLSIKAEFWSDFLHLMKRNAATSKAEEPGCHQFDIATDPARPNEVFLYELYDSKAAFDAHLSTAHFGAFDTDTADMIAQKSVKTYQQVIQ